MASVKSTPTDSTESRAAKMLREIFESGRPLTYVRSAEEQRVGNVLRDVSQTLFRSAPTPVWTWSLTEGLRRDGEAARTGPHSPARSAGFHRRPPGRRHFSSQGFPRAFARICRDPPPSSRRLPALSRPAEIRGHHFSRPFHSRGNRAKHDFRRTPAARIWSSWWSFCGKTTESPNRARICYINWPAPFAA